MFITLKTFYFIIFSLIIGYVFFEVYISENFSQTKAKKSKPKKSKPKKRPIKSKSNIKILRTRDTTAGSTTAVSQEKAQVKPHDVWATSFDKKIYKRSLPCDITDPEKCEWKEIKGLRNVNKVYQGKNNIWAIARSKVYMCKKTIIDNIDITGNKITDWEEIPFDIFINDEKKKYKVNNLYIDENDKVYATATVTATVTDTAIENIDKTDEVTPTATAIENSNLYNLTYNSDKKLWNMNIINDSNILKKLYDNNKITIYSK
jgi:hypothetical protein